MDRGRGGRRGGPRPGRGRRPDPRHGRALPRVRRRHRRPDVAPVSRRRQSPLPDAPDSSGGTRTSTGSTCGTTAELGDHPGRRRCRHRRRHGRHVDRERAGAHALGDRPRAGESARSPCDRSLGGGLPRELRRPRGAGTDTCEPAAAGGSGGRCASVDAAAVVVDRWTRARAGDRRDAAAAAGAAHAESRRSPAHVLGRAHRTGSRPRWWNPMPRTSMSPRSTRTTCARPGATGWRSRGTAGCRTCAYDGRTWRLRHARGTCCRRRGRECRRGLGRPRGHAVRCPALWPPAPQAHGRHRPHRATRSGLVAAGRGRGRHVLLPARRPARARVSRRRDAERSVRRPPRGGRHRKCHRTGEPGDHPGDPVRGHRVGRAQDLRGRPGPRDGLRPRRPGLVLARGAGWLWDPDGTGAGATRGGSAQGRPLAGVRRTRPRPGGPVAGSLPSHDG